MLHRFADRSRFAPQFSFPGQITKVSYPMCFIASLVTVSDVVFVGQRHSGPFRLALVQWPYEPHHLRWHNRANCLWRRW